MNETTVSKAGTYDELVGADGQGVPIYIIEDEPTYMLIEIIEQGSVLRLEKHVQ